LGLSEKIKTTNMHAFDAKGHIKKYASPNEILVEFAEKRLEMYQVRKNHLLKELKDKMPYHENLVEFIRMVCDDELDLKYKTEEECDVLLDEAGFDRIDETFDYLMRLPMRSLTKENVVKHQKDLTTLKEKITVITKTEHYEMWIQDLGDFTI
jgi:DNA topoisomerase-2